jgi:hypothetical protein
VPKGKATAGEWECAARAELATNGVADLTASIFELHHALNRSPHDLTNLCAGEEHQIEEEPNAEN